MSKIMSTHAKMLKFFQIMQGGKHLKYDTALEILEQHSTTLVNKLFFVMIQPQMCLKKY